MSRQRIMLPADIENLGTSLHFLPYAAKSLIIRGQRSYSKILLGGDRMATLLEMTANIVAAHAGTSKMTSEEVLGDLEKVYAALHGLGSGQTMESEANLKPDLTIKQAFKKDEVLCMVCGQGGMKTLTRHLKFAHNLKPSAYRQQFGIPSNRPLSSENFSEFRRSMALERGLADNLVKARAVRAANLQAKKSAPAPRTGR